jgi:hypothetical protein
MGVDAWTRTEYERKQRERTDRTRKTDNQSLTDKIRNRWHGEGKQCACGCGSRKATAFRDGKMYDSRCVGRGSGWDKAGLPQDRTPPMSWKQKRGIARRTKA